MNTTHSEPYLVVMPRLGLSMTEGTIVEWHAEDGEWVKKGDDLFTFESDKSAIVIEAPASGPLHILVDVGETVKVQTAVAVIGEASDMGVAPDADGQGVIAPEPPAFDTPAKPKHQQVVAASPRARAQASAKGLDLNDIRGSGVRGMVVEADLVKAGHPIEIRATPVARKLAQQAGLDLAGVEGTGPNGRVTRADVELAMAESSATTQGMTGLRSIIAERLSAGWRERPQVTLTAEADAVELIAFRERLSSGSQGKIPFDAVFVQIVAQALSEFRYMNATLTPLGIWELAEINIGVAVDTERGLLVPVLHAVDRMTLIETSQALSELSEQAQSGRTLPDDLTGGTFTVTNLGMYGIDAFTPIINPPETGILGIGRIVLRPVAWEGGVALREQVTLSLSFDHRVVDGAPAARFLARIKELIEQPTAKFGGN